MTATLVLVHGGCATPAAWSRVIPHLDDLGIPNLAVQLPSCRPESDKDDAGFLRSVLDECGGPVALVGHSYGGCVLTEAGEHPSVTRLVYLDALMPDVDEPTDLPELFAEEFVACTRVQGDAFEFDADAFIAYFLSRGWSAADAQEYVSGLRPQRAAASVLVPTTAAWRTVPSTFVSCNDSEMKQELFASRATDVIKMSGDHFPNWLRPDEVADILARTARDVADQ
jgi:pimeloyl-ACP methyl ester carboxylesterase